MRLILVNSASHAKIPDWAILRYIKLKEYYSKEVNTIFEEVCTLNTKEGQYFEFKDNDFIFASDITSLNIITDMVTPHIKVKKFKINLITVANATSLIYRQRSYIDPHEELSLYNSELFHDKYILTQTEKLASSLNREFVKSERVNRDTTHFVYSGFIMPDVPKKYKKKKSSITVIDKTNGFKNSDFIHYALTDYFHSNDILDNWSVNFYCPDFITKSSRNIIDNVTFNYMPLVEHRAFINVLLDSEYFITGSISDTLNYSIIEAYLAKCKILAPNVYPFNEYFITEDRYIKKLGLYKPFSKRSLVNHFLQLQEKESNIIINPSANKTKLFVERMETAIKINS